MKLHLLARKHLIRKLRHAKERFSFLIKRERYAIDRLNELADGMGEKLKDTGTAAVTAKADRYDTVERAMYKKKPWLIMAYKTFVLQDNGYPSGFMSETHHFGFPDQTEAAKQAEPYMKVLQNMKDPIDKLNEEMDHLVKAIRYTDLLRDHQDDVENS